MKPNFMLPALVAMLLAIHSFFAQAVETSGVPGPPSATTTIRGAQLPEPDPNSPRRGISFLRCEQFKEK
jgi:hypothetical protein